MHGPARPHPSASPHSPGSTGVRVHEVSELRAGDVVEIRLWDTVRYRGAVDTVCPRLDVLWVLDGPLGDRTLIRACEYTIWKMSHPMRTR